MIIIDISWPLHNATTTYKNKKDFSVVEQKKWETHASRESLITMGSHTGTHIDAPSHFLRAGSTIDKVSLDTMCGNCTVIDLIHVSNAITQEHLESCSFTTRVLLKTRNSELQSDAPFDPNFVYLSSSGAEYLKNRGVICVGIDYLGIERNQPDHATHTMLLAAGIPIIEGLRLATVTPGNYTLMCLPLALVGTDAAPARAVLIADAEKSFRH